MHADPQLQRALRDWHKLTGLSGLAFLLILTVTGIMLELPDESDAALGAIGLPVDHPPHVHQPASDVSASSVIPPSKAIESATTELPSARLAWIETPPASGGTYRLRMQVPADPSFRFPHSFVWVNGATGEAMAVQDAREAASGSAVNNWVHPLHDGSAGGLAGRILLALTGFVPFILFVTGLMRWRARSIAKAQGQGQAKQA